MTLAVAVLAVMWVGLTAYALLAGADFGAGFWDLVAGSADKGAKQRALIEHSLGPVWEANHVWLIFALVVLWTGFPEAFASIMTTLYVPLTAAAFGVILRGSAFAFRKSVAEVEVKRIFGAMFALSSVLTPYFLGSVAGAVVSCRVPPGNAAGDVVRSWVNPTSALGGVLAVTVCAYLAAVFLTHDAVRAGEPDLADAFRRRAIGSGLVAGAVALGGIGILYADAPRFFRGLTGRALPLLVASAIAGLASLVVLRRRDYVVARVTSALAVTAVVWGWAAAQYPYLLEPDLTIADGAAAPAALRPLFVTQLVAGVIVVPSLALLFWLVQRDSVSD